MSNTQCAAGAHAFSDELSGSRSGGSLKEPAEGERKKKKDKGRTRERERKIPERYSLIRWSVEKRYAVLEFGPFCCTRGGRLVCDFNRRISKSPYCVPLRVVFHGDNSTDPIHATRMVGIIFQPRRRGSAPSNPSKTSVPKNLSTLRSAFSPTCLVSQRYT